MVDKKNIPSLVFVYNADSGVFNTMTDIAHKIFSPSTYNCQLCALTHSYFSVKEEWSNYLKEIAWPMVFLHKDEFHQRYPNNNANLPALFIDNNGQLQQALAAEALNQIKDLSSLKSEITRIISAASENKFKN